MFESQWDRPFLVESGTGRVFRYGETLAMSIRARDALADAGVRPGDRVALVVENSPALVFLYLGALLRGAEVVPVDPRRGPGGVGEILDYAQCSLVLADNDVWSTKAETRTIGTLLSPASPPPAADRALASEWEGVDAERPFLTCYTSGTTGVPKGVIHTFGNLVRSASAFNLHLGFHSGHVFYHNLPMTYMAGFLNLLVCPLLAGAQVVLAERFSVAAVPRFWRDPVRYGVNVFWFIPFELALLLELDRGQEGMEFARSHAIIGCVGTAPLSPSTATAFEARYGIPLYESYGLTETLFVASNAPERPRTEGSVGAALDGVMFRIEADGELSVRTPWSLAGYANAAEQPIDEDGFFRTGDFATVQDDGSLQITGRKKDLIKRGGFNVSPRKCELLLIERGIFRECIVFGAADPRLGERTICMGVPGPSYSEDERRKAAHALVSRFGDSHRVDDFVIVAELPRNLNGKVDRRMVMEMFQKRGTP